MPNRYDYELELLKNRQQSDMVLDELDLSEPDVLPQEENATDQHPGVFKSLYDRTGVSAAKPIPTKVDQFPEVNFEESPIQKSASGKTMSQSELSLPPIPNFEVPEFSYPEYQPLEQNNGDSKTKRLLAYLNMAGNDFIRGATGFKPDDGVASGMLEQANQIDKNKTNEKQRLDQYLKNKYDAYNNYNKLKMQADSLRNNALYRRSVIGLKEKQLKQGGETKENAYNKEYGKLAAKNNYEFDKSGGATQGVRLIEETKQIARELRSKFYGKNGELLQPGVLELLKKELGPGGQNWFNVNHSELAQYAQTLKRNYLNQMKTVMGERPTDKDTETYLGTLFDWALSPTANAANLEAKANEMKQRLMANIAMRKHALKTGGDMSTFDPQTVPSGNIEILDE